MHDTLFEIIGRYLAELLWWWLLFPVIVIISAPVILVLALFSKSPYRQAVSDMFACVVDWWSEVGQWGP